MAEEQGLKRRFSGVGRLYGEAAAQRFTEAKVCVAGVGGVGSWAIEALARSAVGHLTLIDLDMVAESNTNRQIHALGEVFGRAKVEVMRERILAINPICDVRVIEDFVTTENLTELLGGHDLVIDAIDQVPVKVAMAAWCAQNAMPLVMVGGAGGKLDPSKVCESDLSKTEQDPLLAKVRLQLRRGHGFPRDPRRKFGISAIYSSEPLQRPTVCEGEVAEAPQGLSCAGYGSSVCVTAPFGFFAAACALRRLTEV